MTPAHSREEFDQVFSLAYEELRKLAGNLLRREIAAQISPTTLVNESWLRLAEHPEVAQTSPLHFRRIAGRAMRQLLVDAARYRQAHSRGGGVFAVTLDESSVSPTTISDRDVLALDDALDVLTRRNPRQALIVEARFFGGLSCQECCEMIGVSEATLMRDWRVARAWLAQAIRQDNNSVRAHQY